MYDDTIVKFGKLKIVIDYNLQIIKNYSEQRQYEKFDKNVIEMEYDLQNEYYKDSSYQNWKLSDQMISISNEINFGFELKTCLVPFHHEFPAQILNFRFQDFQVILFYVSNHLD